MPGRSRDLPKTSPPAATEDLSLLEQALVRALVAAVVNELRRDASAPSDAERGAS
jgi:hypothetical protein